jgi:hypothetical protein
MLSKIMWKDARSKGSFNFTVLKHDVEGTELNGDLKHVIYMRGEVQI